MRPRLKLPQQLGVEGVEHVYAVGDPDGCHVAHAAVGQDLHLGRLALADAGAEIRRDLQTDVHLALQQQAVQVFRVLEDVGDPEGGVAVEGIQEPPAVRRVRLVDDRNRDVTHVGGDHVAEEDQLDQGRDDQHRPVLAGRGKAG